MHDCTQEVLLAFTRDDSVKKMLTAYPNAFMVPRFHGSGSEATTAAADTAQQSAPAAAAASSRASDDHLPIGYGCEQETFPPCGLLPHEGIAHFAAPLCFLYQDKQPLFAVFREMVCTGVCKCVSADDMCWTVHTVLVSAIHHFICTGLLHSAVQTF